MSMTSSGRKLPATPAREGGLTLIELVMFILVVSIALVGVIMVLNTAVRGSADPMVRKQALAIAESLLLEIEQQPFTYCDPNDPKVSTPNDPTLPANQQKTNLCTGGAAASEDQNGGALGPLNYPAATVETRYSATDPFDHVADYAGFSQTNVADITNSYAISGYTASVAISRAGTSFTGVTDNDAVLKIDVTVSSGSESVTLTGYRFRYAPNL